MAAPQSSRITMEEKTEVKRKRQGGGEQGLRDDNTDQSTRLKKHGKEISEIPDELEKYEKEGLVPNQSKWLI